MGHPENRPDAEKPHDKRQASTPPRSRRGLFRRATRRAASWSERASNEASSALAPAPGVAEEAGRQGAPEQEGKPSEPDAAPATVLLSESPTDDRLPAEQPSWRESNAPAMPALLNRKRTTEKRDQVKNIRFTPTALHVINAEAERRGQRFASFVGDAALAVALGKMGLAGSPENDPIRPLVEAVEDHARALNRIGNNLNQITAAMHRGMVPEHTEAVLVRVEQAAEHSHRLIDQLMAEGAAHGS